MNARRHSNSFALVLLLLLGAPGAAAGQSARELREMHDGRRCFDLRDALARRRGPATPELPFYLGAVANRFGRHAGSIRDLRAFLARPGGAPDPALLAEARALLADNYLKTFRYAAAARAYRAALARHAAALDEKERSDYANSAKLWGALAGVAPQTVRRGPRSALRRDSEGRVPVRVNGQTVPLAFDTGANISVVTRSLARRLGLQILPAGVEVGAIAGNKVKSDLGVAREVVIGQTTIRNAVFLVFEDRDLFVAEANFQIDGVVGFPVIAALGEVTFVRGGGLFVGPGPARAGEQNLCLDGLTPLVAGRHRGRRLTFALDTGATNTVLYPPFFRAFERELAGAAPHTERMTGAGGSRDIEGRMATDVVISFAGREARLARVPVLTGHTLDNSRRLYGNIGRNLIDMFASMIINFETMSVVFE